MNTEETNQDARLLEVDQLLQGMGRVEPPPADLLNVRRELAAVTRPHRDSEIMTIEEVGEMLRLSPLELESIVPELPAFELAGRIRIRRRRLLEWIETREKAYVQASIQSAVEKGLNVQFKESVA